MNFVNTLGKSAGRVGNAARRTAYELALKAMFTIDPERIHIIANKAMSTLNKVPPAYKALNALLPVKDSVLEQEVFGLTFPRPLGLAAGFDKNAAAADAWSAVGFGYAELGTVTAKDQPGNPQPRLFRLPEDKAILNRMGFNNAGAAEAARNLRKRKTDNVIGINIGKTKVTPAEEAVADYRRSASLLGDLANFLVVNVSSPNTPGLRDLQAVESLRPILSAVQESTSVPVLVKIAPDLSDEDVDAVADLAVELGLAGIVATNTTISRDGLNSDDQFVRELGAGGISGAPVAARSLEVLKRLYARVGDKLVIISVGGINTPQQAWERITSGATLLQGYTGLIYGGPDWVRDIHRGLARQIHAHSLSNISEAIGSGLSWKHA
ncbi:quinone-dependent dihydroorotate dehydrogenase [Corynebacterium ammoniagenes]|uniref:Dihydroorotate dehydrogenase (quinone) n=2 Tax=Corynebacterium ammoniagenes TaxID=1697 RepID=A0AAV5G874_CORAM|nr:quinone-dependent dihydroorotate dehydrogenase [Corynebacterium ammoniagenes]AQS73704.1 dihydroorotate dehydrogenase (quinone) [Corynebacterium ammoniagenes]EFG82372.1 dihydroorotate oxidase [Corynebacterium ammoniagenes DSM 20306]GJN42475.1 dihydroorotate dehydrogenase (quinone) [Corynebacterium ammoniagenes]